MAVLVYTGLFAAAAAGSFAGLFADGRSLIWEKDAVGQYYPAFLYIGQYLRSLVSSLFSGHPALPLYDLKIGFGEDIIGTLNYYGFGDPLNLAAVFAVGAAGPVVYALLFFLRAYLAGLSLLAYLKEMKITGWPAAFGAAAYALSGFTFAGAAMYAEWGSVLIYFPLMLLAAERIMTRRGRFLMTAAVFYGALSGFYFLYMASLALAVYVIARLVSRNGIKAVPENSRVIFTSLLYYVIGILLASPILMPALDQYLSSQRSGHSVGYILKNAGLYKPVLNRNLFRALTMRAANPETTLLMGIPALETLAALMLICLPPKILPFDRRRKELLAALALGFIALSLPMTGYLFNAFAETNDRWIFLIVFLLAVILSVILHEADERYAWSVYAKGILAAVMVLCLILPVMTLYGKAGYGWGGEFLPRKGLNDTYILSPVSLTEAGNEDGCRVDTTALTGINGRPENVAMLNGYNGTTYWWSIVNGRTQAYINLVNSLGYRWRSFGLSGNADAATLAGVRYLVTNKADDVPEGYEKTETVSWNGGEWSSFENTRFYGLAYLRSSDEAAEIWADTVGEGSPDETEALMEMAHHRNPDDPWDKSGVDGSGFCAYLKEMARIAKSGSEIGGGLAAGPKARGYVESVRFEKSGSHITVLVKAEEKAELVTAVPFHKNWKASVDGQEVTCYDTDVMFMAVDGIPEGRHTIEFTYVPRAFYAGLILCAAGLALCVFLGFRRKKERMQ